AERLDRFDNLAVLLFPWYSFDLPLGRRDLLATSVEQHDLAVDAAVFSPDFQTDLLRFLVVKWALLGLVHLGRWEHARLLKLVNPRSGQANHAGHFCNRYRHFQMNVIAH